jgi:hypothetical protein
LQLGESALRLLRVAFSLAAHFACFAALTYAQSAPPIEVEFGKRDDITAFHLRIPRRELGAADPKSVFFRPTDRKTFSVVHTLETKRGASFDSDSPPTTSADGSAAGPPTETAGVPIIAPPALPADSTRTTVRALARLYKEGDLSARDRALLAKRISESAIRELTDERPFQPDAATSSESPEIVRLAGAVTAAGEALRLATLERDDLATLVNDERLPKSLRAAAERLRKRKDGAAAHYAAQLKELERRLQQAESAAAASPPRADSPLLNQAAQPKTMDRETEIEYVDVYGRLRDAAPTSVALYAADPTTGVAKRIRNIPLTPPASIQTNEELVKRWARRRALQLAYRAQTENDNGFSAYEAAYLTKKFGLTEQFAEMDFRPRGFERESLNAYSVLTGAAAIRESLQTDVALAGARSEGDKTIPIGTLTGPIIKSHPFAEMTKGRESVLGDMERLIPHDHYFLHFNAVSDLEAFAELAEQWGGTLLNALEAQGRDRRVKQRVADQLALEPSKLFQILRERPDSHGGDIGVTGADPYFTDGNDVTVIFKTTSEAFLRETDAQREIFKRRIPAAVAAQETHRGVAVDSLVSPNREVSSHRARIGDYWILSNSLVAMRRIIDVATGARPSLRNADEYRYMRSVFPARHDEEDVFLYLSDAFIRRVVGPEQKIARKRQLQAVRYLSHVQNAALLRAVERGDTPDLRFETLAAEGRVEKPETGCPNCGAISFAADGTAASSVFGGINRLTPLIEVPVLESTQEETDGYLRFVENYNRYWSRFFDPVGIRFRLRPNQKIEAETCILPLIENSVYNGLRDLVGGEARPLTDGLSPKTVASLGFALRKDGTFYRNFIADLRRGLGVDQDSGLSRLLDCSEGAMTLNVHDNAPQLGVNLRDIGGLVVGGGRIDDFGVFIGLGITALTMPVYATLDVKDAKIAQQALDQTVRENRLSPFPVFGTGGADAYFLESHRNVPIGVQTISFFGVALRLYAAVIGDKVVVATQRETLVDIINARLDGPAPKATTANASLNVRPEAFDKLRFSVAAAWQERMRQASFSNFGTLRTLHEDLNLNAGDIDAASLRWFGYTPLCPSGAGYSYDAATGDIRSEAYGDRAAPRQSVQINAARGFARTIESVGNVAVRFQFTPEGVRTKLIVDLRPTP